MTDILACTSTQSDVSDIEAAWALLDRPPWHRQAACLSHPKVDFFPRPGQSAKVVAAKAICARCPVQAECLAWALTRPGRLIGVWGGTSERDRRRLSAQRNKLPK